MGMGAAMSEAQADEADEAWRRSQRPGAERGGLGAAATSSFALAPHASGGSDGCDAGPSLSQASFQSLKLAQLSQSEVMGRDDMHSDGTRMRRATPHAIDIRCVALHLARGLEHLHARGLAHLDVKPRNILVGYSRPLCDRAGHFLPFVAGLTGLPSTDALAGAGKSGSAAPVFKLADLGRCARWNDDRSRDGDSDYIAPETLNPVPGQDRRPADIFALGLIMLEMLSGSSPRVQETCVLASGDWSFGSLSIDAGATLTVALPAKLKISNSLTVAGILTGSGQQASLEISATKLTVESAGVLSVDGRGYVQNQRHASCGSGPARWGGFHGGGPAGKACGDYEWPTLDGAGGTPGTGAGGTGGGSLIILCNASASSEVSINGTVSARGTTGGGTGSYAYAGGAGAGGSILIVASRMSGWGTVSADGGDARTGNPTGLATSVVRPDDLDGGAITLQTRSTVMQPLEVSAASITVHEHGRAVLPPTVVVRGASLVVDGELVGMRSLLLDTGSSATLSKLGGIWVNDTALGAAGESWAQWACESDLVPACASRGQLRASGDARGRYGLARLRMVGDATLELTEGVTALGAAELWVEDTASLTLPELPAQQFRLFARDSLTVATGAAITADGRGYVQNQRHASCGSGPARWGGFHGGGPAGKACGDYEWPTLAGAGGTPGTGAGGTGGGSLIILCNASASSEIVPVAPGRTRFEVDELHLGRTARLSLAPLDAFDPTDSPDVRSLLTIGAVTSAPGTGSPAIHVQGGTTLTFAGVAAAAVQTGLATSVVRPDDLDGGAVTLQTRSTVMQPLEVSAASITVHEHGRAVLPPTVVVRGASLVVDGELVGMRSLLLDTGSSATLSKLGGIWVNDTALGAAGESWAQWACESDLVPACASRGQLRASGDARGRYGLARLRMVGDATLELTEGVTALGAAELWVEDTASLTLPGLPAKQFRLLARDSLTVATGAAITADGRGYVQNQRHASCGSGPARWGGFHGGGPAGKACGDYEWPTLAGAGGTPGTGAGGTGGGSLIILCNASASSEVSINGTVSARGTTGGGTGSYAYAGGAGAGGSILIVASRMSGLGHRVGGRRRRPDREPTGPDDETNPFRCALRRLEVDNSNFATPATMHSQIVPVAPGRTRFEVDELHLGRTARLSLAPLDAFDPTDSPDVRSLLTIGAVTSAPGTGSPAIHVQGGTTLTFAGVAAAAVQTGLATSVVRPDDLDGGAITLQTRSTVMQPLEVSAASITVHEHGRAVLPPRWWCEAHR
ncbi:hypothetical protein FNF27_07102 [Cafeteria roenbergensis]|uniref:Protein kinase domain-containing protein n=1 Tax=Cafeteria roenbergensis TaxID=33653 RepID=A0A5A8DTN2_CAFRO|nr:hypothetical protein FNF27_07102 [Cafeteria roenbergensis]